MLSKLSALLCTGARCGGMVAFLLLLACNTGISCDGHWKLGTTSLQEVGQRHFGQLQGAEHRAPHYEQLVPQRGVLLKLSEPFEQHEKGDTEAAMGTQTSPVLQPSTHSTRPRDRLGTGLRSSGSGLGLEQVSTLRCSPEAAQRSSPDRSGRHATAASSAAFAAVWCVQKETAEEEQWIIRGLAKRARGPRMRRYNVLAANSQLVPYRPDGCVSDGNDVSASSFFFARAKIGVAVAVFLKEQVWFEVFRHVVLTWG
jgi:hypothetical protein